MRQAPVSLLGHRTVIRPFLFLALAVAAQAVALAGPRAAMAADAGANASAWVTTPQTQVRLIAAENGIAKDGTAKAATTPGTSTGTPAKAGG